MRSWLLVMVTFPVAALADGTIVAFPTGSTTSPLPFIEYLPPGYTGGTEPHRVVFMFHGQGESGAGTDALDLRNTLSGAGPMRMIRDALAANQTPIFATTHKAIVLSPRNPSGLWNLQLAITFYDWALANYRIDRRYIYLTGLSAGGGPSWGIPPNRQGTVAAVLPVCPVTGAWPIVTSAAAGYEDIAVWAFHSFGDPMVPRGESSAWMDIVGDVKNGAAPLPNIMASYPHQNGMTYLPATSDQTALFVADGGYWWTPGIVADAGTSARYTLFNDATHFIWHRVYDQPFVWDWLFQQRRRLDGGVEPDGGTSADAGVDAGAPLDASVPLDAGTPDSGTVDAGVLVDAGASDSGAVDAGGPADAGGGADAGPPDAGSADDAGVPEDAGALRDGGSDAGEPGDAGAQVDAGVASDPDASVHDAGALADGGVAGPSDVVGGCGCRADGGLPMLLLVLAAVALRRRAPRAMN